MKLITRDSDYAIRTMCCIAASSKTRLTVSGLSQHLDIPKPFLRKILQRLNRCGFLESYKGKNGGFQISASPEEISVLDIIKAFQGDINIADHVSRGRVCPQVNICYLKLKLDRLEEIFKKELTAITIYDMLKNKRM